MSWTGERDTLGYVDQPNKATHTYTVQPIVSRDGKLIGKLLICFQERGGRFGPRVEPQVRELENRYGNIHVLASQSGKMSVALMHEWLDRVVFPELRRQGISGDDEVNFSPPQNTARYVVCPNSTTTTAASECSAQENVAQNESDYQVLLLGDSWGGNTNAQILHRLNQNGVRFMQIPPHTTSELQPLDISLLRQYKYFVHRIYYRLALDGRIQEATSRSGLMNIHSLVYNQFSAPLYADLIRHGWRNLDRLQPGERNVDALSTEPLQFSFNPARRCQVANCTHFGFVQCAHCGKVLCIDHFLNRTHFHEDSPQPSTSGSSGGSSSEDLEVDDEVSVLREDTGGPGGSSSA
jgi:hypothetical protein